MTTKLATRFTLKEGETYRYNFPGSPGGIGTFLGWLEGTGDTPWFVMEVRTEDARRYGTEETEIQYFNSANLNALVPKSDPRI